MEREICKKKVTLMVDFSAKCLLLLMQLFSGCCLKNQSQMVVMRKRKAIKGTL